MPQTIEEILSHRTDLSTFLVHLTREGSNRSAKSNLRRIISDWKLVAGTALGPAAHRLRNAQMDDESQKVVCFTETPLEYVKHLCGEIEGRNCQFSQYGIAITKKQGRRRSVNPIWYLDATPDNPRWMNRDFEALVEFAIEHHHIPELQRILKLAPFVEQMGTWPQRRKEFWWEREWRRVGDLRLPQRIIVFCPEDEFDDFRERINGSQGHAKLIDPTWSLERMIAHLAGFPADDAAHP